MTDSLSGTPPKKPCTCGLGGDCDNQCLIVPRSGSAPLDSEPARLCKCEHPLSSHSVPDGKYEVWTDCMESGCRCRQFRELRSGSAFQRTPPIVLDESIPRGEAHFTQGGKIVAKFVDLGIAASIPEPAPAEDVDRSRLIFDHLDAETVRLRTLGNVVYIVTGLKDPKDVEGWFYKAISVEQDQRRTIKTLRDELTALRASASSENRLSDSAERRIALVLDDPEEHSPGPVYTEIIHELARLRAALSLSHDPKSENAQGDGR